MSRLRNFLDDRDSLRLGNLIDVDTKTIRDWAKDVDTETLADLCLEYGGTNGFKGGDSDLSDAFHGGGGVDDSPIGGPLLSPPPIHRNPDKGFCRYRVIYLNIR